MLVEKKKLRRTGLINRQKHKQKIAAVIAETKIPEQGKLLLGTEALKIEDKELKRIAQNSVGYIYIKGEPVVHGTGFICAKKFERLKELNTLIIVTTCGHMDLRNFEEEVRFNLDPNININESKYPDFKLYPIISEFYWLRHTVLKPRLRGINPITRAAININDATVYLGVATLPQEIFEQLEALEFFSGDLDTLFQEQATQISMRVLGYNPQRSGELKMVKQLCQHLSYKPCILQQPFNSVFPYGKGCYECTSIQFNQKVIAGHFSGISCMSGSPLLLSSDGGSKWHVLGIYTEQAMGKITRALDDIKDYYRAKGTLLNCEYNFKTFDSAEFTLEQRETIRSLVSLVIHRILLTGQEDEGAVEQALIGIESEQLGWEKFNHNVVIRGGPHFKVLKSLIFEFEQASGLEAQQLLKRLRMEVGTKLQYDIKEVEYVSRVQQNKILTLGKIDKKIQNGEWILAKKQINKLLEAQHLQILKEQKACQRIRSLSKKKNSSQIEEAESSQNDQPVQSKQLNVLEDSSESETESINPQLIKNYETQQIEEMKQSRQSKFELDSEGEYVIEGMKRDRKETSKKGKSTLKGQKESSKMFENS